MASARYYRYADGFHEFPQFADPVTQRVVDAMGWGNLCASEDGTADRARFLQGYEAVAKRCQEERATLPIVRELTATAQCGPHFAIGRLTCNTSGLKSCRASGPGLTGRSPAAPSDERATQQWLQRRLGHPGRHRPDRRPDRRLALPDRRSQHAAGAGRSRAMGCARQVESARAYAQTQIAQAQVEMARAHEAGSTERMQVFALTLKSLTADNQGTLTLLAVGVLILAVLQLVQASPGHEVAHDPTPLHPLHLHAHQ